MSEIEEEKKEEVITEQKSFWIKVVIILVVFLIWRNYAHSNWCKKQVSIFTFGAYTVNKTDAYGISGTRNGKFKTYDDALSSCKADWTSYLFKSHK